MKVPNTCIPVFILIAGFLLFIVEVKFVDSEHVENQPSILTNDGSLVLAAIENRNITIRLAPNSVLLVNDTDIYALINEILGITAGPSTSKDDDTSISMLPTTLEDIVEQLELVKNDLQIMAITLQGFQNSTRDRRSRRLLERDIRRLAGITARVQVIERNLDLNECTNSKEFPCKNGGSCYDAYLDYHCECPDGWTGKSCEADVNECYYLHGTELGCQNEGECVNTMGSFRCICRKGYSGTHCRLQNATCDSATGSEICGHGTCIPDNSKIGYTCICDQGWTRNGDNSTCTTDVDECASATNPCHSECINLPGTFQCGPCPRGYTGNGINCIDIDECAFNNGGCSIQPSVNCINTEGSHHCGQCPPNWTGDGRTCTPNIKPTNRRCASEVNCYPGATCRYIVDVAICQCPVGMYGHGFGEDGCTPGQHANTSDLCATNPCRNNGTCITGISTIRCLCPAGFLGRLCDQEEACHPNPCQNGATCTLQPRNEFRCNCLRGTTGTKCEILRSTCSVVIRQESGELSYPSTRTKDRDDGRVESSNEDEEDQEDSAVDGKYLPNERCAWIIRTEPTKVLNVTFNYFDLEDSPECSRDWLQIHDGRHLASQLIGRFCGQKLPLGGNILSSHYQLFFWFRSDNATQGNGLKLSWTSQEHTCGGEIDLGSRGSIVRQSPGYPGKAPSNRECEWKLDAAYGHRLLLRFYEVNVGEQSEDDCDRDTIKIFDSDRLMRTLCKSQTNIAPLYSSSNRVVVHLHTDGIGTDSSFLMHAEAVAGIPGCGGVYTEPTGFISGYMNADVCLFLISQPAGIKIELQFTHFDLIESDNCSMQTLEVFDGDNADAPLLKRLCGKAELLEPIITEGNAMLLRYEYALKNMDLPHKFEARYRRACGDRFFGPGIGVITTPNYPQPYYEHMYCVYNIYGPLNTVIKANFTDFSISESTVPGTDEIAIDKKNLNYMEVYLSGTTNVRRYYYGTPLHLTSVHNHMRIIFNGATNSKNGRGLRIEYSFENLACGGVFTEPEASIEIGQAPSNATECIWIIEAPEGNHINLNFSFNAMGQFYELRQAMCDNHISLTVYENSTYENGEGQLLYNLCNGSLFINQVYSYNTITIILRKPLHVRYIPLSPYYKLLNSTIDCGGLYLSRFGIIKTPDWPKPYAGGLDCEWTISAPVSHQIELNVHSFNLQDGQSEMCRNDYLEIRNGLSDTSPLIGKFCGSNIPQRIPSFGNEIFLHFHSDSYVNGPGFNISWEQTATGCGGQLNSHVGSIHSLNSKSEGLLGRYVVCDYRIDVAEGSTIDMDIAIPNRQCDPALLMVYDGPTAKSRQLWNCEMKAIHSNTKTMLVRYTIREGYNFMPFYIDYKTNCHTVLEAISGAIESPNFPDTYPPLADCRWDLRAGRNNHIAMSFSHLQVEQNGDDNSFSNSCNDYVEIADMRNDEQIQLQRLCVRPTEEIRSVGNRLIIRFVSDYLEQRQGFRAEYRRIGCGERLQNVEGRFTSPGIPYNEDIDCLWEIEAPAGNRIKLTFTELHIERETSTKTNDCKDDILTVANDDRNSSMFLLKNCAIEDLPLTVISHGNHLVVRFKTSAKRGQKYFKATYSTLEDGCGGDLYGSNGMITTPHSEPITNTECLWTLNVSPYNGIDLSLDKLNLTIGSITIFTEDRTEVNIQITHRNITSLPYLVRSDSNKLNVKLETPEKGWGELLIHYKQRCGGQLQDSNSYIRANMDDDCSWKLQLQEITTITFSVLKLECSMSNTTLGNGLAVIWDDKSYNFCDGEHHYLQIAAKELRVEALLVEFNMKYTMLTDTCGGMISSLRGSLVSPHYPETYPDNVECVWSIIGTQGNRLELNFESFDLPKSEHCNEDYVEVHTHSQNGPMLGVFCGSNIPTETLFAYDLLWIKFRSVEGSTAKGFKLNWHFGHDNDLNGTDGMISQPPIISARLEEEPYSWRIQIEHKKLIRLQFKLYNSGLKLFDGFNDDVALQIDIQPSPWTFISSSNVIYLVSNNAELEPFTISWDIVDQESKADDNVGSGNCTEVFVIPPRTYRFITSPGYPNGYDTNLNCSWTITSQDPSKHIVFDLTEVDLESMPNCLADSLRIFTAAELGQWHHLVTRCDAHITQQFLHRVQGTPHLQIQFFSDSSINGTGFRGHAYTGCGSNMTGPLGFIGQQNVPGQMTNDFKQCEWHVHVRPGKRIAFYFDYGNTTANTSSEPCSTYATIYDGIDEGAPVLTPSRICIATGNKVAKLETQGNEATLRYTFGPKVNKFLVPWNLTYREIGDCHETFQLTTRINSINISSPRYPDPPQPHTECDWIVSAPVGTALQVEFIDRFDLNHRYCSREYVELFDGSTSIAPSLGRYCTKPTIVKITSGNLLYLRYFTDINEPHSGFRAQVSIATCGGTVFPSLRKQEVLTSKGYPVIGAYPRGTVCEYTIRGRQMTEMVLNITDLHLPYDARRLNNSDSLQISWSSLGTNQTYIFYGNQTKMPSPIAIDNNVVTIIFRTSYVGGNYRGFKLTYEQNIMCYRTIVGTEGSLAVNTANHGGYIMSCRWKITVPKGQRVRFEVRNVQGVINSPIAMPPSFGRRGPVEPKISFFNDASMRSLISETLFTNVSTGLVVESTDNVLIVQFHLPTLPIQLLAYYSSEKQSDCPDDIGDKISGLIFIDSLKDYKNFHCQISFTINDKETISFEVKDLAFAIIHPGYPYNSHAIRFTDGSLMPYQIFTTNITSQNVAMTSSKGILMIARNNNIRLINVSIRYHRQNCGGSLNLNSEFALNYENTISTTSSIDCVWLVKMSSGQPHVIIGNITLNGPCEDEYLVMYRSATPLSGELLRLCGENTANFQNITITSSKTLIVYHTVSRTVATEARSNFHFYAQPTAQCGSEIRIDNIHVPIVKEIDKTTYKNNMECFWDFKTLEGNYLSLRFENRFFVETSMNCSHDYVEIQQMLDGFWQSEERFCGRELPPIFNSLSSKVRVIFHTNENVTGDGFRLKVKKICDITLNVTSSDLKTIWSSPDMRHRSICTFTFVSDSESLISVRIKALIPTPPTANIHYSSCSGKFNVFKNNNYEDVIDEPEFACIGEELRAQKFLRLTYTPERSFVIEYSLNECGGNITTAPTMIMPPKGEDNVYMSNMRCIWHIHAPVDHSIVVRFKYIDIESHFSCVYDYLAIYTDPSHIADNVAPIKKYCGEKYNNTPTVVVDNNQAMILAVSDETNGKEGFLATITFTRNCNEQITLMEGHPATLTRQYQLNTTEELICDFKLIAPVEQRISIVIQSLQLNNTLSTCHSNACDVNCNSLELTDSKAAGAITIGRYCVNNRAVKLVSSFEDALLRLYAPQGSSGLISFEIELVNVPSNCGGNLNLSFNGNESLHIFYPPKNETAQYLPNVHCKWHIESPKDFVMQFKKFELENVSQITGKCKDYLLVSMSYSSSYYCGNATGTEINILKLRQAAVDLTFHSDSESEAKGFHIIVMQHTPCNHTYTGLSGIIAILSSEEICHNEIHVPSDYIISIFMPWIYFGTHNCTINSLQLIDINNNTTLGERCRGHFVPKTVYSNTNAIRIVSKGITKTRMSYLAIKKTLGPGCGGEIINFPGYLTPPPSYNSRNYSTCRWVFTTAEPARIRLDFQDLNMGADSNCHLDHIDIYETSPNGGKDILKHVFCGSTSTNNEYTSESNRVVMVSQISPNFAGTGWSMRYEVKDRTTSPDNFIDI